MEHSNIKDTSIKELYQTYFQQIKFDVKNKKLSKESVWGYLRHLPRNLNELGESAAIIYKCLCQLFLYSKRKTFIPEDMSFSKFIHIDWR